MRKAAPAERRALAHKPQAASRLVSGLARVIGFAIYRARQDATWLIWLGRTPDADRFYREIISG